MSTTTRPIPLLVLAHVLGVLTAGSIVITAIQGIGDLRTTLEGLPYVLLLSVTLVIGWLLAVRMPRHPVGWILMAIPALFTTEAGLNLIESAVGASAPRLSQWIDWYNGTDADPSWAWFPPVWLLLSQLPLRFPNGRLPSRRWRWFFRVTVADLVSVVFLLATADPFVDEHRITRNPVFVPAVQHLLPVLFPAIAVLTVASFVGSIGSLFVRYRAAAPRERAQLRWMMWAVALAIGGLVLGNLLPAGWEAVQSVSLLLYALVPIAVAVAVLRYRLYEIDRIISRTVAYAIVTLVVIGTYALVVLLVSLLVPATQGRPPAVVIALATLAAAAVFLPALRWIRRLIDRVFNRSQYDAERVVIAFGERIRNGADPHTAGVDLLGAVGQTLQPSGIGIWVREDAR